MTWEQLENVNKNLNSITLKKNSEKKDREYVEVNKRVLGFRQLYPEGSIRTEFTILTDDEAVCVARVLDDNGRELATGTAWEKKDSTFINKTSYVENCETSAVGRALGFMGIGIDASIASKEEVENAKANQETKEAKKTLTKEEADEFEQKLIAYGVNIPEMLKRAKVESLTDFTPADRDKVLKMAQKKFEEIKEAEEGLPFA